jgi:M6 family metalloprotease-like protein
MEDGSLTEVQRMGDEHYHYLITREGKTISKMPRVQQAQQAVGTPMPIPRVLVILVSYTDIAIQPKNTAQALDSLFNYTGYAYNGATGSVNEYFTAQSDSQYMPTFDVVGPVTMSNNRKYYGENNSSGNDKRAGDMIKEACKAVDDIIDFSQYDSDGDGKVDAVYVIYAGIGANDYGGEDDAIWPHQHYVTGLTLDGKQIYTYACSGEIDGVTKDRTGIGPICHEFGHAIGMPDYYSTSSSGQYMVGEWSVMDFGMYDNGANTPPNYSIFDKQYMGWATVKELKADRKANLVLTTDYDAGYKMTVGETTYYIENRQLKGWDIGLPGHGMLVWQVKYDQTVWGRNQVNYTVSKPRYAVVSAARGVITDGNVSAADPFPGTQRVTGWTASESFVLSDISESWGKIQFKLNGGKTECTYEIMSEHCQVPEDGVLALGNTLQLTITPEEGYTLDNADCWAVEMGEDQPLLEYGEDYTYDAQTGAFVLANVTDDVVIIVEAKEDQGTGIETVDGQKSKVESRKIFRNGQLMIIRGEKKYNAQGIEIQ